MYGQVEIQGLNKVLTFRASAENWECQALQVSIILLNLRLERLPQAFIQTVISLKPLWYSVYYPLNNDWYNCGTLNTHFPICFILDKIKKKPLIKHLLSDYKKDVLLATEAAGLQYLAQLEHSSVHGEDLLSGHKVRYTFWGFSIWLNVLLFFNHCEMMLIIILPIKITLNENYRELW